MQRVCIIDQDGFYIKSAWFEHPHEKTAALEEGQSYVVSATPRAFNRPRWNGEQWEETDYGRPSPRERRIRREQIIAQLNDIDRRSNRALRAFALKKATEKDVETLENLESEAAGLREELQAIEAVQ